VLPLAHGVEQLAPCERLVQAADALGQVAGTAGDHQTAARRGRVPLPQFQHQVDASLGTDVVVNQEHVVAVRAIARASARLEASSTSYPSAWSTRRIMTRTSATSSTTRTR
jgi:hypothetical protein